MHQLPLLVITSQPCIFNLAVLLVQMQPLCTYCRSWKDNVCQTKAARARDALQHNLFMANPVLQVWLHLEATLQHPSLSGIIHTFRLLLSACSLHPFCSFRKHHDIQAHQYTVIHPIFQKSTVHRMAAVLHFWLGGLQHSTFKLACGAYRSTWWQYATSAPS